MLLAWVQKKRKKTEKVVDGLQEQARFSFKQIEEIRTLLTRLVKIRSHTHILPRDTKMLLTIVQVWEHFIWNLVDFTC